MRPLLSWTTDGRLEIAAAQQVVQKKKKGGKLGDTIKSDAPWTSPAPLGLCGEFASGMHVRNSGVLERQLSGITPGAWPIPTILKGKRQDALPVWRTGGSLLPLSPLCVFTFWIVAKCSHRGFASARLLSFSVPFTTKALVTFEIPCVSVSEIHLILTDESFLVFLLPARNSPFCNVCFHFFTVVLLNNLTDLIKLYPVLGSPAPLLRKWLLEHSVVSFCSLRHHSES